MLFRSVGTIKDRWDTVDVNQGYLYILGEEYFVEELGLKKEEVAHFIGYVMQSLNLKNIKKKGYFLSEDITKFQVLAEKKIKLFKKLK